MDAGWIPFLFFALFAVMWVTVVMLASRSMKRAHEHVRWLAETLGLLPEPAERKFGFFYNQPRAHGALRGKPAELFGEVTGSGKSRRTWAVLTVRPRESSALTLSISRQGFASKLSQLFGAREVTVGDPRFDAEWFIQTNEPEFLRAALIPELRDRLSMAWQGGKKRHFGTLKLEHGAVRYAESGDFSNRERCERFARVAPVLADLADVAEVFAQTKI